MYSIKDKIAQSIKLGNNFVHISIMPLNMTLNSNIMTVMVTGTHVKPHNTFGQNERYQGLTHQLCQTFPHKSNKQVL